MKKRFLSVVLAATITSVLFAGCASNKSSNSADSGQKQLVISTFGLNEDKIKESLVKPFEESHNVKITLEVGDNSERLTKLKNNPNSNVDIMYLAEAFSQQGIDDGLFEKLDYSKIQNAQKVNTAAKKFVDAGYGPAYTQNSIYIMYDPKAVGKEITSWSDLWDSSLAKKVAIPDISTTFGPATLYLASQKEGISLDKDNGEAGFKGLEELKPNILKTYTKSSDLTNLFSSGEIVAAVGADFVYGSVKKAAPNVKLVAPKEGVYLNFNTININKNSKNKDLAYEFIDYALSKETQERNAKELQESPVNVDAKLSDDVASELTYGSVLDHANTVDDEVINKQLKNWIDKWNKLLNQ